MNNRKGGKTPLLPVRALLIGLLICANVAMAGILLRSQNATTEAQRTTIGGCKETPGKLKGIPLSLDHPGVTQEEASEWQYRISGTTLTELNESIKQCSPVRGAYTANTQYVLNWRVNYKELGGGQCAVDRAATGIRIRHTYPRWETSSSVADSTKAAWNVFMDNLTLHEDGHAKLNQQYAEGLLNDLQAITNYDCKTIEQHAKDVASARTSALASANQAYDSNTGHGSSQGAKLLAN